MSRKLVYSVIIASFGLGSVAHASVVRVDEDGFNANAGQITFSEFALGTINPVYNPVDYGGGADAPVVTTGGYFEGQMLSGNAGEDCPGAAASACVVGSPTADLAIDAQSPNVFITTDGDNPTSPVLSGSPIFNGPIALLFSVDQFAVGFDGGFFNAAMSTGITAFARDGSLLGTVSNEDTGIEFLGLASASGDIAGVFLDLVGAEPAGFGIDNVRFASRTEVTDDVIDDVIGDGGGDTPSPVPLPAGLPLLLGGLGMLGLSKFRKNRKTA